MRNLLILLVIITPKIIFGQEHSIEKILKSHFINLEHIECNYKQEKKLSMLSEPLISTGIFKYERNRNIIWEQQIPFKKTFSINDKSENKLDKHINQFITSIINGEILEDKRLEVIYSQKNDNYMIVMIPKKGVIKKRIKKITLTFRKKIISLNRFEIIFKNSDVTNIKFYDN
tara:strand:+ start:1228 stop:1746 length:519 start_codon:yes stop_codon:yes gene_type:complete